MKAVHKPTADVTMTTATSYSLWFSCSEGALALPPTGTSVFDCRGETVDTGEVAYAAGTLSAVESEVTITPALLQTCSTPSGTSRKVRGF